jgi:D-alanine-D-alanine ligase
MKNLLLLFGGGSTEHDISKVTCEFLEKKINTEKFKIFKVEIKKDGLWLFNDERVFIDFEKNLKNSRGEIAKIDLCLPAIHGYPAETGDLQSFLKMIDIPFFGVESEPSSICFNKVLTKLWLNAQGFPTTPFIFLKDAKSEALKECRAFYKIHKKIFIKASNQGSSIGCYPVNSEDEIENTLIEAFKFSEYVLVESFISGRELEVSVFEYDSKVIASSPGEINCPDTFYDYNQKYAENSHTQIDIKAKNLSKTKAKELSDMAIAVFNSLKLRDLSRVDFFLAGDKILINEINTFPGMTPISLFPQMLEATGIKFEDFINQRLESLIRF